MAVNQLKKIKARQTILFELLRPFGFSPGQAEEAEHLLSRSSGKYLSSPTHRIFRNRDWLIITSLAPETSAEILITENDQSVPFGGGLIQLKLKNAITDISADPATAMLDAEKIVYPLLLRKWRQGDYFYPLGMPKKKKISRFLIDQKMSVPDKENVWVIESDKRIIWVVGMRIDHRFRISDPSRQSLIMTWKK